MYSSRGPVCDIHNEEVLKQLTDGAKELAKKYHAMVLKIEPDIKSDDKEFREIVTKLGYKIKDDAKDFRDEIQPRYVFRLDIKGKTEDEVFKAFHSKTRYNVRLAGRKGVTIKEGNKEDLKDFHKIMIETGKRDGFMIRPLEYFEQMYDALAPEHMKVLMAYYEGKPISGVIPIMYGNKTWYLYGASSNEHRNLMPNYLLQWEMIKIAISRGDDIYDLRGVSGVVDENHPQYGLYRFKQGFGPISGVIPIMYGNKTWYLYGASSNEHRNLMPNYLLQWEMIKIAISRGDDIYDLRGVSGVVDENHPQYGLYRFKQGFGAEFTEFIGELHMDYSPIRYNLYKISEKIFKRVRTLLMNRNKK